METVSVDTSFDEFCSEGKQKKWHKGWWGVVRGFDFSMGEIEVCLYVDGIDPGRRETLVMQWGRSGGWRNVFE